ncbi:histidine kinase [Enterovibrio makurazakiensis]|uniref:Histidine kinase n=1 Tax=Enterovibrio gelatinilyticus TaxID=2899819 RepID=A0ABT5R141_9GAMM|nr:histidine kinase [Enterovibrio sp. ZSDZ42]MDD1793988.1 histidine kinase [Enterovibrio sp. ZSDZ42]
MDNNPTYKVINLSNISYTVVLCFIVAFLTQFLFAGSYLYHVAISFGYCLTFTLSNNFIAKTYPNRPHWKNVIVATLVGMPFGGANMLFWMNYYKGLSETDSILPALAITTAIAFCIAYFFITQARATTAESQLKDIKLQQAEQEKALINSQLRSLQGQMEPHFLFNTLANIQVLIDSDSHKAKMLLEKITDLLRASLKQHRKDTISLTDELRLLDSYLSIQQIRLSDRMGYTISLDDSISPQTLIPPFLIQPAVENAVVHGIEPSIKGGHVQLNISKEGNRITVEVTDNGIGFNDASKGHGLSMKNVRQRLSALYGEGGKLELIPHSRGGFTTRISIQCEQ